MRKAKQSESSRMMRPALTPEARENQLVSLAVDLAEKQLREGTFKARFDERKNRKRNFGKTEGTDRGEDTESEIY